LAPKNRFGWRNEPSRRWWPDIPCTHELVVSLRNFIREALDLAPIPPDLMIPQQGPTRPSASGARGKTDRGNEAFSGGGGGMGGGGMGGGTGGGGIGTDDPSEDHPASGTAPRDSTAPIISSRARALSLFPPASIER
jgi:hypothetical protein